MVRDDQSNDLLSVNKVSGATSVLALKIGDKDVANTLNALEARLAALETTVMQQASTIANQAQTIQGQASTISQQGSAISALQARKGTVVNTRGNPSIGRGSVSVNCVSGEAAINCQLTGGSSTFSSGASLSGNSCTCTNRDNDDRAQFIAANACKLLCLVVS